ncbi:hypothetical protein LTS07_006187 [Exophiala sideris]|uniref:Galactose oxidase n=1 Tax=Exophiala sideris TaxID=1016849 RepID=A0ABR0J7V5_9EURO|nr:hypothetical protein LTS07_006187 [Exophiala sideris]KAK5035677.1 hypothetical protein LTR13_005806 [Exophiala sideris]KAK5057312.1 hypothetical protein LTR69_007351 [Exophiala sideris]KAK5181715.1 hypothetical protein LTR44_005915 [Eurotiomycetes sp. CCFEE 6388]
MARQSFAATVVGVCIFVLLQRCIYAHTYSYSSYFPLNYDWVELSSSPTPRQEHAVASIGNNVYVIGGITANVSSDGVLDVATFRNVQDVQVYDIDQDSWSYAASMPISVNHGNAATVNGKIYMLGNLSGTNFSSWNALSNSYVYDPELDTWTDLPPMPSGAARGACAVGVYGSTIYLAGGITLIELAEDGIQASVDDVTAFNTETGKWYTDLPPLPGPRDHVAGAVIGSTFYVTGGRVHGSYNTKNNTWALDLTHPTTWVEKALLPTARGGLASATDDRYLYTFGGEGNPEDANGLFNNTEVYDPETDVWWIGPAMASPRHGTRAVSVGIGIYLPGGGLHMDAGPTDSLIAFEPRDVSKWTAMS